MATAIDCDGEFAFGRYCHHLEPPTRTPPLQQPPRHRTRMIFETTYTAFYTNDVPVKQIPIHACSAASSLQNPHANGSKPAASHRSLEEGGPSMAIVTRVYKHGLLAPTDPAHHALALQLLGQASNYAEALRRIYNDSSSLRKKIADTERDAHVHAWEATLAEEERAARKLRTKEAYERLDELRREGIRNARRNRGHLVDAGTYWLVEAAALAAAKASGTRPIASKRFDGGGRIGAAIQVDEQVSLPTVTACERCEGQLPKSKRCAHGIAFGTKRFTVEPIALRKLGAKSTRDDLHTLTIHVGELKSQTSIAWPLKISRPFPPGAKLKQVAVQRVRRGHRFVWEALFTLTFEEQNERDHDARGIVGIDVGWRLEARDRLRVATHNGQRSLHDVPEAGALFLDTVDALEYADSVESFRDQAFNAAKAFAQDAGIAGAEHAKQWQNFERLHRLALLERDKRLPGGGNVGLPLWRERDKHLEDIASGVRGKALRRRKDSFAVYADVLAKKFRYVVLEDMPMADWVGQQDDAHRERIRSAAAVSFLQMAILHRFGPDRVHWEKAEGSTRTCAICGTVRPTSVGPAPLWECEGCGASHHQDENAAVVLRKRGEGWIDGGNPPGARTRKMKVSLKKKKGASQKGDMRSNEEGTSREALDMAAEE